MKRSNYISRDDYFMSVAVLSEHRSKDPSTQVGSCIVNPDKRIIGIGYNGFPRGCDDDIFPWTKDDENFLNNRNTFVVHAEANAILNTGANSISGSTIYIRYFPCHECAKLIIQADIKRIVYLSDSKVARDSIQASKNMLKAAQVELVHFTPAQNTLTLTFT